MIYIGYYNFLRSRMTDAKMVVNHFSVLSYVVSELFFMKTKLELINVQGTGPDTNFKDLYKGNFVIRRHEMIYDNNSTEFINYVGVFMPMLIELTDMCMYADFENLNTVYQLMLSHPKQVLQNFQNDMVIGYLLTTDLESST